LSKSKDAKKSAKHEKQEAVRGKIQKGGYPGRGRDRGRVSDHEGGGAMVKLKDRGGEIGHRKPWWSGRENTIRGSNRKEGL